MKHQIFVDCDGVLADFDQGCLDWFGDTPDALEREQGSADFWRMIKDHGYFYDSLIVMEGAKAFMEEIADARPIILTGVPLGDWAAPQKIKWAQRNFPGVPMVTCRSRDKALYCKPGDILIDDRPHYRDLWEAKGGHWVTHTDFTSTRRDLSLRLKDALT